MGLTKEQARKRVEDTANKPFRDFLTQKGAKSEALKKKKEGFKEMKSRTKPMDYLSGRNEEEKWKHHN